MHLECHFQFHWNKSGAYVTWALQYLISCKLKHRTFVFGQIPQNHADNGLNIVIYWADGWFFVSPSSMQKTHRNENTGLFFGTSRNCTNHTNAAIIAESKLHRFSHQSARLAICAFWLVKGTTNYWHKVQFVFPKYYKSYANSLTLWASYGVLRWTIENIKWITLNIKL